MKEIRFVFFVFQNEPIVDGGWYNFSIKVNESVGKRSLLEKEKNSKDLQ
jgi:hypothetical protein